MEEVILALLVMIRAVESTDGKDPRANGNEYHTHTERVYVADRYAADYQTDLFLGLPNEGVEVRK